MKFDGLVTKPKTALGLRNFNELRAEYLLESIGTIPTNLGECGGPMIKDFDMEHIVKDLKNIFQFKKNTREGDIVLIVAEHLVYALVTDIEPDTAKRDQWWHVTMHMLTVPPQKVTWTLREPQFTGKEIFTMGGEKRFIKALSFDDWQGPPSDSTLKTVSVKSRKRPTLKIVK